MWRSLALQQLDRTAAAAAPRHRWSPQKAKSCEVTVILQLVAPSQTNKSTRARRRAVRIAFLRHAGKPSKGSRLSLTLAKSRRHQRSSSACYSRAHRARPYRFTLNACCCRCPWLWVASGIAIPAREATVVRSLARFRKLASQVAGALSPRASSSSQARHRRRLAFANRRHCGTPTKRTKPKDRRESSSESDIQAPFAVQFKVLFKVPPCEPASRTALLPLRPAACCGLALAALSIAVRGQEARPATGLVFLTSWLSKKPTRTESALTN